MKKNSPQETIEKIRDRYEVKARYQNILTNCESKATIIMSSQKL